MNCSYECDSWWSKRSRFRKSRTTTGSDRSPFGRASASSAVVVYSADSHSCSHQCLVWAQTDPCISKVNAALFIIPGRGDIMIMKVALTGKGLSLLHSGCAHPVTSHVGNLTAQLVVVDDCIHTCIQRPLDFCISCWQHAGYHRPHSMSTWWAGRCRRKCPLSFKKKQQGKQGKFGQL